MHKTNLDHLYDAWHYWNKCFLGRTPLYQPRRLPREDRVKNKVAVQCPHCGKSALSLVVVELPLFNWNEFIYGDGISNQRILDFIFEQFHLVLQDVIIEILYSGRYIKITSPAHKIRLMVKEYGKIFVYLKIDDNPDIVYRAKGRGSQLQVYDASSYVCHSCKIKIETEKLSISRKSIWEKNIKLAETFRDLLDNCEKKGTCDILAAHKETLKDDDNRLHTDTMVGLICKNDYDAKWTEILNSQKAKLELAKQGAICMKLKKSCLDLTGQTFRN